MNGTERIRYSKGNMDVLLGDRVSARVFLLINRSGRVVYIPGVSLLHKEMEHDGIRLVGIKFDDGGFGGFWVDPSNSTLIKSVKFVARDGSPIEELPAQENWA